MDFNTNKKADFIREMLLKTVSKSPDLFSYFVAIQEARELLGQKQECKTNKFNRLKPSKRLGDG
ncbi:MAG: hypothetical protein HY094_03375 [Candidatus Melainabacteria bacterium]|nr:hypothetical protein [Candidatus Melainabacteria bacterium]